MRINIESDNTGLNRCFRKFAGKKDRKKQYKKNKEVAMRLQAIGLSNKEDSRIYYLNGRFKQVDINDGNQSRTLSI